MAIDIFDGKALRLSIPERAFSRIAGAQEELRKAAGRTFDGYGRFVLEPEHARLWLVGLQRVQLTVKKGSPEYQACEDLASLLRDASLRNRILVMEGE